MDSAINVNDNNFVDEQKLIEAAQSNQLEFKHLFNRYFDVIFNYALRRTGDALLAEESTANTFLKALDNIKRYKWKGISFSAWLYRIATSEINQIYRKRKKFVPLTSDMTAQLEDERSSDSFLVEAEELIAQNEKFERVHAAIARLKLKYQDVLTLRYFENKSIKEIAQILDKSENTIKTHIRRGLIQLRDQYERL